MSISRSMPTRLKTRSTGGAVMASRMVAPFAPARRAARTRAVMPDESQNVVAVMSTTRPSAPALRTDSSASRTTSALVTSISAGSTTTATWRDHITGKHSSDTQPPPFCGFQARAGRVSGPWITVTPGSGAHRKQHYADLAGLAQAAGALSAYAIPGGAKPGVRLLLRRLDSPAGIRAANTAPARFRRGTRVVG